MSAAPSPEKSMHCSLGIPLLVPDPNKKPTASLVPGFYDQHFSDKLVLKRVERLPSLVQDVANDVDKALRAASPTLPLLCPGFITVE